MTREERESCTDEPSGTGERSTDDTERERTSKPFENIRYRLMWWIAPVSRETVGAVLKDHVETWDESEYDSARMLGNLLRLWDDRYFDTDTDR